MRYKNINIGEISDEQNLSSRLIIEIASTTVSHGGIYLIMFKLKIYKSRLFEFLVIVFRVIRIILLFFHNSSSSFVLIYYFFGVKFMFQWSFLCLRLFSAESLGNISFAIKYLERNFCNLFKKKKFLVKTFAM